MALTLLLYAAIKPCQLTHEASKRFIFCHSGAMRSIEPGIQGVMARTLLLYAAIKPCQLAHEGVEARVGGEQLPQCQQQQRRRTRRP
jgi:hypothetical protein